MATKWPDNKTNRVRLHKYSVPGAIAQFLIKEFSHIFVNENAFVNSMPTLEASLSGHKRQRITMRVRNYYVQPILAKMPNSIFRDLYSKQQAAVQHISNEDRCAILDCLNVWLIDFNAKQYKAAKFYATLTHTGSEIRFAFYVEYTPANSTILVKP